jgi:two-component system, NarL family, nitrate/nitrite response regulator NarL
MKIILVDDHDLVRAGLKMVLQSIEPTLQVMETCTLAECISVAKNNPDADLVLFDLGLPGYSGITALQAYRKQLSHVPVVVLSGTFDRETVEQSLEAGAMGFIPKTASPKTVWNALNWVLNHGVYVPPCIFNLPTHQNVYSKNLNSKKISEWGLTKRQLDVFKLVIQGKTNKEIANHFGLAESTIKSHIKPILKTLNVPSRTKALAEMSRLEICID